MSDSKLKIGREDDIVILSLADPATLNAVGPELTSELIGAFKRINFGVTGARAVVLTGEGTAFCSGANLSGGGAAGRAPDVDGRPDSAWTLDNYYHPLIHLIRDMPVPLITAVSGAAAGIGCAIALMGDLVVAGESAFFLQAFRRIGLGPDGGISFLLPRIVGKTRAMEMLLLGERLPASKALEWGLINRCVPDEDVMRVAMDLASNLSAGPGSLGMMRRAIWQSLDNSWLEQIHLERDNQLLSGKSEDFREGVAAFAEKRPAKFTGR